MDRGYVLWEGGSPFNGEPIVAIATMQSSNEKTGNMVQVWILSQSKHPTQAIKDGTSASICGTCPAQGTSCYVQEAKAPAGVYRCYKNNGYSRNVDDFMHLIRRRDVRLGAYGDPAMVPFEVLDPIVRSVHGWTGYTHQWLWCDPRFREICMASVDTEAEYHAAKAAGWRTFRVKPKDAPRFKRECVCPASDEAGNKVQCIDCRICQGTRKHPNASDVVIDVHGTNNKVHKFTTLTTSIK